MESCYRGNEPADRIRLKLFDQHWDFEHTDDVNKIGSDMDADGARLLIQRYYYILGQPYKHARILHQLVRHNKIGLSKHHESQKITATNQTHDANH